MDVISISSDSETSEPDIKEKNSFSNWEDGIYNVDWNDDIYPSIDYDASIVNNKSSNNDNKEEEIEDFVTPLKSGKKNNEAAGFNDADDTVDCFYEIDDCSFSEDNKRTISSQLLPSKLLNDNNDNNLNIQMKSSTQQNKKTRQKLSQEEKIIIQATKEQKKFEKERTKEEKRAEQIKQKALKAALLENHRNLKPEENIKFIKVHIDNEIINSSYGCNIISVLQQNNIQYVVEAQIMSSTIIWSKKKIEKVVNDCGTIEEKVENKEEDQLLFVIDWEKAVELVHNNELLSFVETVKSSYIEKKLTLIICGLGKYFEYKKNQRNREMKANINEKKKVKPKPSERIYDVAPNITKDELEFALTDLQILGKHNCRLLETPEELSFLVLNFTKSLSQIELKLEQQKRRETDLGWIAAGDFGQCVKVDKNGNGLLRLWQQQICQFNAVGSEAAQAVVSQFNSPFALITQYNSCKETSEEELLLQNIQIRREAGILSSSRRIGPQLSKKIHKFFTSSDPDLEL